MRKRNRSLTDMVGDVEKALHELDQSRDYLEDLESQVALHKEVVTGKVAALQTVRDALFTAYPEIAGNVQERVQQPEPTLFEPVEVDDADDPRYTGSGGPIEFEEK